LFDRILVVGGGGGSRESGNGEKDDLSFPTGSGNPQVRSPREELEVCDF